MRSTTLVIEGRGGGGCWGEGEEPSHSMRVVKAIFVTRDRPLFFPVKCETATFLLVNRDFQSGREA